MGYDLRSIDADAEDDRRIALTSSSGDPTVAMAFKTIVEDFGPVTFVRVYQGRIEKGNRI